MGEGDDELFRYLEREIKGERAAEIVKELRATYLKYLADLGPVSTQAKIEAGFAARPDADAATVAQIAQTQVMGDAILAAVALYLANHDAL